MHRPTMGRNTSTVQNLATRSRRPITNDPPTMPRRQNNLRAQCAEYDPTSRARASAPSAGFVEYVRRLPQLNLMRRFQHVVADSAPGRNTKMNGRSPALQPVMSGAMKQVRDADRCRRGPRLDPGEQRMVI